MRLYPNEIEADLLLRGIDIYDWYQGRMSSRRLLNLIGVLEADEDSNLARERRDHDWSLKQYLQAAQVNEMRRFRADQAAIHASHKMEVATVDSPAQTAEAEQEAEKAREVRSHIMSQLMGKK